MTAATIPGFAELPRAERVEVVAAGTALFVRALARIPDADLGGGTLLPGWSGKHLAAHVGYNARALTRLLDWAETGVRTPMYPSPEARGAEIAEGAEQEPRELRSLVADSAAELDRRWRALSGAAWRAQVVTAQGRTVRAEETLWMRAREVWIHAVDLDSGTGFDAFPEPVLTSLLTDITGKWRATGVDGIVLEPDGAPPVPVGAPDRRVSVVAGPLPAVVRWAAGRGSVGLHGEPGVPAPRWL